MQTKTILFSFITIVGAALTSSMGIDGPSTGISRLEPRAVTKRTAFVSVRNQTPYRIAGVSVVHKYSDNYKNRHEWGIIPAYQLSGEHFQVEYNTGAFTTGRDWWALVFYSEDMKTLYYTNPDNLRGVLDFFEGIAPDTISAIAGAVAAVVATPGGPAGSIGAAAAAAAAAKLTTNSLFNSEGTAGFKQHILREEDENQLTEIVITALNSVTFKSKSGVSTTSISQRRAPGQ